MQGRTACRPMPLNETLICFIIGEKRDIRGKPLDKSWLGGVPPEGKRKKKNRAKKKAKKNTFKILHKFPAQADCRNNLCKLKIPPLHYH